MYTRKNKANKNDAGVSPVIGVILMVAITVVMATIVSSWSSGVKAPATPTTVGLDISRSTYNISVLVTSIDPASAAPMQELNISYLNSTNQNAYSYNSIPSADVGSFADFNTSSTNTTRLIITAKYKDNSKKVLYNQLV